MVRAVAYLRVSQADENVENQRMKVLEFARKKGIEPTAVVFFQDIDVSGTTPPRQRPQYRAMLDFCRTNNVKIIIFYDLSRLARDVIEGLNELKRLADEGFNVYFAGMDFLNYDIDPMMKKKIITDFLWFVEHYVEDIRVEDIRRRTKIAMERLKKEGRVYTRPRLIHYIALYLKGLDKPEFNRLSREDIEYAREYMRKWIRPYIEAETPFMRIYRRFLREFNTIYIKYDKVPRSYVAFIRMVKNDLGLSPGKYI